MSDEIPIPITTEAAQKSVNDLLKALDNFGNKANAGIDKFADHQESAFKKVSEGFESLKIVAEAAIAAFAVEKVVEFLGEATEKAVEQEQAMRRLETALQATGEGGKEAAEAMGEFSEQLAEASKFSKDQVIDSLALGKAFGVTNDQAKQLTQAAADLASATGESLESATRQLAGTYEGVTRQVGKLVPEIKNLTAEQYASGEAVRIVGQRFADSAEKEVQTYGGAVIQAKNSFEELQVSIGKIITQNPGVIAAINANKEVFKILRGEVDANKVSLSSFITEFSANALEKTAGVLETIPGLIDGFTPILTILGELNKANPFLQMIEQLPTLVSGLGGIAATTKDFAEGLLTAEQALIAIVALNPSTIVTSFADKLFGGDKLGKTLDQIQAAKDALAKIGDGAKSSNPTIDKLVEALKAAAQSAREAGEIADENKIGKGFQKTLEDTKKLKEEIDKLEADLRKNNGDAADQAKTALDAQLDVIERGHEAELISDQQFFEDRVEIYSKYTDKVIALDKEKNDKLAAADAKAFAEQKQIVNDAFNNPIGGATDIINGDAVDQDAVAVAVGAGIIKGVSKGKDGAKSLLEGFANSIPIYGPILAQLIDVLSQGKFLGRQFGEDFGKGIPDLLVNLTETLPAIAEGLITSLENGGVVRLAEAFVKAIVNLYGAPLGEIGRLFGAKLARSFNSDEIGRTLTLAAKKFASDISNGINEFFDTIQNRGFDFAKNFHVEIGQAASDFVAGIEGVGQKFVDLMDEASRSLGLTFTTSFGANISDAFKSIEDKINATFSNAGGGAASAFFAKFAERAEELIQKGRDMANAFLDTIKSGGSVGGYAGQAGGKISSGTKSLFSGGGAPNIFGLTSGPAEFNAPRSASTPDNVGGGGASIEDLLQAILDKLSSPVTVTTKLNESVFAEIILNLARRNARTTIVAGNAL